MSADEDRRRRAIRSAVLADCATHPLTLAPIALGASALAVAWAAGTALPLAGAALFTGLVLGLGAFLTRLALFGGQIADEVASEFEATSRQQREHDLDQLAAALAEDGDPRTGPWLARLRDLDRALDLAGAPSRVALRAHLALTIDRLLSQAVSALRVSVELQRQIRGQDAGPTREAQVVERTRILDEVAAVVARLEEVAREWRQGAAGDSDHARRLGDLRAELDQQLDIARRVEHRLAGLGPAPASDKHP